MADPATFDELPLGPETVAALAAEGIETPTPFQAAAIPVIARGNDVLGRAGPGSGTMVAYAAPLLDRLKGGAGSPICLVLCTGQRQATELARSLAGLCEAADVRVGALTDQWNLPERADFLFVPADRFRAVYDGTIALEHLGAVVLHDGDGIVASVPADHLEAFLGGLPGDCQRVVCGLPFGPGLHSLAARFTRRAVRVPAGPLHGPDPRGQRPGAKRSRGGRGARHADADVPPRTLKVVVAAGDRSEAVLTLATELLRDPVRHLLVFAASADQAADLGDFLATHGYLAGPPGDASAPVWISPGEDEAAREALDASPDPDAVATLSASVPAGAHIAAIRHGAGGPARVLAEIRELAHLKEVAAEADLALKRIRPARPRRVSAALDELADSLHEAARAPGIAPYYLLVESLLDRFSAAEVAAAALLLLDRKTPKQDTGTVGAGRATAPESWIRLFVSAGKTGRNRAARAARRPDQPVRRPRQQGGQDRCAREPLPGRGAHGRREKGDFGSQRHDAGRAQPARRLRPRKGRATDRGRGPASSWRWPATHRRGPASSWRWPATHRRRPASSWRWAATDRGRPAPRRPAPNRRQTATRQAAISSWRRRNIR